MELVIGVGSSSCDKIKDSLAPDNPGSISARCDSGNLCINVSGMKIASLYNTVDDLLRCYEVSKKIVDGSV